ncbi:uncharacterized protein LOC100275833 [Zea mays]|jgi:hypothetical protein|uniref:Uncharacterized protein n=1 Tax=Zea mays TaxID=4577 RepID=A0A804MVH5_MAIZE|nr:uncharacterized protein LOC100275833 [Zea mays]|eukprot:XP_008667649.1 uncharacterized protein LOC100275833 isoform X1 [Zea mays]
MDVPSRFLPSRPSWVPGSPPNLIWNCCASASICRIPAHRRARACFLCAQPLPPQPQSTPLSSPPPGCRTCETARDRHRFNRSTLFPGHRSTLSSGSCALLFPSQPVEVDLGSVPIAVELPYMFLSVRLSLVPARSRARGFEALRVRRAALCASVLFRQNSPSTMFK